LVLACSIAVTTACSGTNVVVSDGSLQSLESCQQLILPYDLWGATEDGLECLGDWLEEAEYPYSVAGKEVRSNALLDLWVFSQLTTDDQGRQRAIELVDGTVAASGAESFDELIRSDLAEAEVERDELATALELLEFDIQAASAAWDFGQWNGATHSGPRLRLILASLLARHAPEWLVPGVQANPASLDRFGWLCGAERGVPLAHIAGRCGYWCDSVSEAEPTAPPIEREAHELVEDDTPVEVDLEPDPSDPAPVVEDDDRESAWRPTIGDVGYELVSMCGSDYFRLPSTGDLVLLNEANFVRLVYLDFVGQLLSDIEGDLIMGEPLTVLSSDLLADYSVTFLDGAAAQELTPAALVFDVRLELPRLLGALAERRLDLRGPELRIVSVLSSGVHVGVRPHLQLARSEAGGYELDYPEGRFGLHYPGEEVVPFPRLNRLDEGVIEDGRLPALETRLSELEDHLGALGWATGRDTGACRVEPGTTVSVLVDGSTPFGIVKAVLASLLHCGYEPTLHGLTDEQILTDVPGSLAQESISEPHHTLTLRSRNYSLEQSGAAEDEDPFLLPRSEYAPISRIASRLSEWVASDSTAPLVVVVEDSTDFGTVANVLQGLGFRRIAVDEVERDADFLRLDLEYDGTGSPRPLVPAGVVIRLAQ